MKRARKANQNLKRLDPAYQNIGAQSCVGMTGNWSLYPWTPAIMLGSALGIFVIDVFAQKFVADKYGLDLHADVEGLITNQASNNTTSSTTDARSDVIHRTSRDSKRLSDPEEQRSSHTTAQEVAFAQQFAAFLILEFGIIWHSIFIGLNFGVAGEEWSTLYIVLMFHQSFEGLGIGARMSSIPFPEKLRWWLPWLCISAYGITTPVAMAVGLAVRTTYNSGSYQAVSFCFPLPLKWQEFFEPCC